MKNHRRFSTGFTLIELVLLVSLVSLLAAILVPVFSFGRESVNRAHCRSNLQQIGIALHQYANENNNRFPRMVQGNLPHDVPAEVMKALIATGAIDLRTFYCPSGVTGFQPESWDPEDYPYSYFVTSYIMLLNGTPAVSLPYVNRELIDPVVVTRVVDGDLVFFEFSEAERELALDGILTVNPDFSLTWNGETVYPRSNHVNGTVPAGGNILFLDGHVEWRSFDQTEIRITLGTWTWFW